MRRGRKGHFRMNAGMVKLSTIHSIKGLEGHTVVLILGEGAEPSKESFHLDALVYTAFTRARQNLIVIDTGDGRHAGVFSLHTTPVAG